MNKCFVDPSTPVFASHTQTRNDHSDIGNDVFLQLCPHTEEDLHTHAQGFLSTTMASIASIKVTLALVLASALFLVPGVAAFDFCNGNPDTAKCCAGKSGCCQNPQPFNC
jgi:hypothetical protein